MHVLRLAAFATALILCLPAAHAELIRVPMGSSQMASFPASFEALRQRMEAVGYDITYNYPPTFDPYFSANGGAHYGNISGNAPSTGEVSISWVEFADVSAAAAYQAELAISVGVGGTAFRSSGRVVIIANVYTYPAQPNQAAELLALILGR